MRKSVVLYHADCNDGFAAAYAAWVALGEDEEYVPVKYGGGGHKNAAGFKIPLSVFFAEVWE